MATAKRRFRGLPSGELFDPNGDLHIFEQLPPAWSQAGAGCFITFRTPTRYLAMSSRWELERPSGMLARQDCNSLVSFVPPLSETGNERLSKNISAAVARRSLEYLSMAAVCSNSQLATTLPTRYCISLASRYRRRGRVGCRIIRAIYGARFRPKRRSGSMRSWFITAFQFNKSSGKTQVFGIKNLSIIRPQSRAI